MALKISKLMPVAKVESWTIATGNRDRFNSIVLDGIELDNRAQIVRRDGVEFRRRGRNDEGWISKGDCHS